MTTEVFLDAAYATLNFIMEVKVGEMMAIGHLEPTFQAYQRCMCEMGKTEPYLLPKVSPLYGVRAGT